MITKESLIRDREQAKVALIRFKQLFKPHCDTYYLIVEGKDDLAFYYCVCTRYPRLTNAEIIPANNRKNVVDTYSSLDWSIYPKERVLFFVDRDLSEMTHEYTPEDVNVYVTDMYSIENSLFSKQLFIMAFKVYFRLEDLEEWEIKRLEELYQNACDAFYARFYPIMSWILYWRINGIRCNLNNLNDGEIYYFEKGVFGTKEEYQDPEVLAQYIHRSCNVPYQIQDINTYKTILYEHGGIEKNLRGKYLKTFFVKLLNSISKSFPDVFPCRSLPRPVVTIGISNALQLLCGYMQTPETLERFLEQFLV